MTGFVKATDALVVAQASYKRGARDAMLAVLEAVDAALNDGRIGDRDIATMIRTVIVAALAHCPEPDPLPGATR